MKNETFDYKEFMEEKEAAAEEEITAAEEPSVEEDEEAPEERISEEEMEELRVQKVVVEKLASENVELNEKISSLLRELDKAGELLKTKDAEIRSLKNRLAEEKERKSDLQERNPNALALLDRDVDLPDRFPGETRDHVIEAVRKCRDEAEAEGRDRKAQLLESVLLANEPNGTLERLREELKKIFEKNGNIVSGPVMEELRKRDIPFKKGEEYLMPAEILAKNY